MTKSRILLVTLCVLLMAGNSFAREKKRNFGLGVTFGTPTGFTGKFWFDRINAVQVTLAWAFSSEFQINADYLWHNDNIFKVTEGRMPVYFGTGLRAELRTSNPTLGIRGTAGFEYIFPKEPFEIFLELSPAVLLIPATVPAVDGGFGFRYYF